MIEFENDVVINRPLEEVFAFISDFENMSKWNYYVMDVNKITDGPVDVGTTYHQTRKTDQQQFRVIEFKPNELVAIETLPPERKLNMRFRLESTDEGTQIIDEWRLETSIPGPFNWLAVRKAKSAVAENLEKLRILLETGRVTLQDGRQIKYKSIDPKESKGGML
jgi:uncharacterized membrane protein